MGLSYFWSYMYYLTQARSEYYVHSPFVYALMCDCLKRPGAHIRPESRDRLCERLGGFLLRSHAAVQLTRIPPGRPINDTFRGLKEAERAAVFIDLPHRDKTREADWNALCADPKIALTIDLFRVGLAFPCRDMDKEHFCLRYF